MDSTSKLIKRVDSYDIWRDVEPTGTTYRVIAVNRHGSDQLVAAVDTLEAALRCMRRDSMGE